MGETSNPAEIEKNLTKVKEESGKHAWQDAYSTTEKVATTQDGRDKFNKAFKDDKSGVLPNLQLVWGKENLKKFDSTGDGGLDPKELAVALKSDAITPGVDRLFLGELAGNFQKLAGKDGKITIEALTQAQQASEAQQAAADLKAVIPNEAAFKDLDIDSTGVSKDKLTKDELATLKNRLDTRVNNTDGFNKLSKEQQENIKAKQRAVDFMNTPENFKKIAGEGNDYITYDNLKDFADTASGKPTQNTNAPEAMYRALQAHFDELKRNEPVLGSGGANNEARINQKTLSEKISALDKMIKDNEGGPEKVESNKALKNILENVNKNENFEKIANANPDGGSGISQKELEAYKQLHSPNLVKDVQDLFGDKLNTGITQEDVKKRLIEEKASAVTDGTPDAARQRRIETLSSLADGGLFNRLAQAGQPIPISPSSAPTDTSAPPPPPPPGDTLSAKIDIKDLESIKAEQSQLLKLPKELMDTTTSDAAAKSEGVRLKVEQYFSGVQPTKLDGTNELKFYSDNKAIGDYGISKIGYHRDAAGNLDTVIKNPESDKPDVFQKDKDEKGIEHWYYRPNGINNTKDQAVSHELGIDKKGAFVELLSGSMKDGVPASGSSYHTLDVVTENNIPVTRNIVAQTDGSVYGYGHGSGAAKADRLEYRASLTDPFQQLMRIGDSESFRGNIKTEAGNRDFVMSNPTMAKNGVFTYDAYGHRWANSTDGLRLDERIRGHLFDAEGRFAGCDWRNGNQMEFTRQGNEITSLVYNHGTGSTIEKRYYDRALGADGKQKIENGIPVWTTYTSRDADGKPKESHEVAFKPEVDASGRLTDTGRKSAPQAPPGYTTVFDWDANQFFLVPISR